MEDGGIPQPPEEREPRRRRGRLGRYRQVVQILARHGFGWMLGQLGIAHRPPFSWGLRGREAMPIYTAAQHLRLALEELGATYVKLGQILSTRPDLLPPDYVAELSRLQDAVPPESLQVIEAQLARELGSPVPAIFAEFDPRPLGSASIGQVHAARLATGEDVVVKVQRPGVDELVEEDLSILADLARLAAGRTVWGQVYDLPEMVEEFAATLRSELNYLQEARNAERIRRSFVDDPHLRVPAVYHRLTTRRVLTMERLHGIKISDTQALQHARIDRALLAENGARLVLKMILEDGFFHADPHPGNFIVMPPGAIGLVDYGMVGQVEESTREGLLYLVLAVASKDIDRVVDQLVALGVMGTPIQLDRLRRDLRRLLSLYWGIPIKEIDVSRILDESLETARRHRLQMPTNLVLLAKTLAMNEGLARTLDPEFSAASVLEPYAARLAIQTYLPRNWSRRVLPTLVDLSRLAVSLPRRTERLLTQLERGNLLLNMKVQDAEHFLDVLNALVNRIVLGMLISGFAVGIALLLQIYDTGGFRWAIGVLLGVGMAAVLGLGVWLAVSIIRQGRH